MCQEEVNMTMRETSYDLLESSYVFKDSITPNISHVPRRLYNPVEPVYCPPKGVAHNSTHNLNVQASQHYNTVEDLAQAPCSISTLGVL